MKTKQKILTATEFKAKCLKLLDHLDSHGLLVTKRGRPVARVIPVSEERSSDFYGAMKEEITIKGNIFSTGIRWHGQS